MTVIIAIANAAGSAGKSSTTVNLAALLARRGKAVIVADADAQATATGWLGVDTANVVGRDIGALLLRRITPVEALTDTNTDGVRLVPSTRSLDADLVQLATAPAREQRLRLALEQLHDHADVILIDCPGQVSMMTVSALVAATSVVTVTQPTAKEINGIPELENVITEVAEAYRPGLRLAGIVPCIVPPATAGRLYQDALQVLDDTWPGLITPPVRRTTRVPEAHAANTPLPVHAPRDPVTADYEAVLDWLTTREVL